MTYGEVDKTISEIDERLFNAETAQIKVSWEEYSALKLEADALMDVLAKAMSEEDGKSFDECYLLRQKLRAINKLSSMGELHMKLHPEPNPENDAIIASAFGGLEDGTKTHAEASAEIASIFDYLFANAPHPPEEPKRGFFRRIFRF